MLILLYMRCTYTSYSVRNFMQIYTWHFIQELALDLTLTTPSWATIGDEYVASGIIG